MEPCHWRVQFRLVTALPGVTVTYGERWFVYRCGGCGWNVAGRAGRSLLFMELGSKPSNFDACGCAMPPAMQIDKHQRAHPKAQKRTGDALPKRVEQVIETGKALVTEAKGWDGDADRLNVGASGRVEARHPHRRQGTTERGGNCRDRATALIEDIWCEKIRGCSCRGGNTSA